ncbi:MAG: hypothetical protein ACOCRX_01400 [Candidatus Woesearchaeota archaeon]
MRKYKVVKIANKYNLHINDDGTKVSVEAPNGYVFKGTDLHCFDIYYLRGRFTKSEVWAAIYKDTHKGIEKCDKEFCDCCQEGRNNNAVIGQKVDINNQPIETLETFEHTLKFIVDNFVERFTEDVAVGGVARGIDKRGWLVLYYERHPEDRTWLWERLKAYLDEQGELMLK